MHSVLSVIEIWPRSRFEPMSETLSNCHVGGYSEYFLKSNLHKPGVKIPKWVPRSLIGVNMVFRNMHSTQVGLVINLLTGSISPQYHVVFYEFFSTLVGSTAAYP